MHIKWLFLLLNQHQLGVVFGQKGQSSELEMSQVIMQLSNLGIEDDHFLQLLDTYLHSLANMLKDDMEAHYMLQRMNTSLPHKILKEAGIQFVQDPFFRSMLMAYFRYSAMKYQCVYLLRMATSCVFVVCLKFFLGHC